MSLAVTRNMIGLLRPSSHSFYQHSRSLPTHTKTGALRGSSITSDQRSLPVLELYQHTTSSLEKLNKILEYNCYFDTKMSIDDQCECARGGYYVCN